MRDEILPYANVLVRVDGRKLKEYDIERSEDDAHSTAIAYIEAKSGAHFSVDLELGSHFPHKKDHLQFSVTVDGNHVRTMILTLGRHKSSSINGVVNSSAAGSTVRRLTFAELVKTDLTAKSSAKETLSCLGEIKVVLTRCREIASSPSQGGKTFTSPASAGVSEKALKGRAISSHTVVGAPEKCRSTYHAIVDYPHGRDPIATYIFRYRTHRDLQSEGILERPPSPVQLEDRDPDTLTLEEGRELARRNKAERERQVAVKKEGQRLKRARSSNSMASSPSEPNTPVDDGEVEIAEGGCLGKRARRVAESEVIDLSAD